VIVVMWFAGCRQPEAPSQQRARLLVAQDAELQKQLAARDAQIEALQQKHAQELRLRDQELIRCKVRISDLQRDLQKGIDERIKSITTAVMDENAKLRQEVEQLKAEIKKRKEPAGQS